MSTLSLYFHDDKIPIVNVATTCAPSTEFPTTARWELIHRIELESIQNPFNEVDGAYGLSD